MPRTPAEDTAEIASLATSIDAEYSASLPGDELEKKARVPAWTVPRRAGDAGDRPERRFARDEIRRYGDVDTEQREDNDLLGPQMSVAGRAGTTDERGQLDHKIER